MNIKWYGTATLLLESGGSSILLDPYLKGYNKKLPPVPLEEARRADAIFITHPHLDHFQDVDAFTKNGGVPRVFVPEAGLRIGKDMRLDTSCMVPIRAGETYAVGPFTVKTYESRHCVFDAETIIGIIFSPRTYLCADKSVMLLLDMKHFKCEPHEILAYEISDGEKRVFVLGSAALCEDVEYPAGCDLLVFPYQGKLRMHTYMESFLHRLQPKGVFCDHFDDAFPPFTKNVNTQDFAPTVEKCLPDARAIVPSEGVSYEV